MYTIFIIVLYICSATLFCLGVLYIVKYLIVPLLFKIFLNLFPRNTMLLSLCKILTIILNWLFNWFINI